MAGSNDTHSGLYVGESWIKRLGLCYYDNMLLPAGVELSLIPRVKAFTFADDDVLICTFPRSGTTWTQEMTWLIYNNADTDGARAADLEERVPFIEFIEPQIKRPSIDFLENRAPPRLIKTHFPPQFYGIGKRDFKTILVMRNVKDVVVSYYHFIKNLFEFKGSWDDLFELFKQDKVYYGSWLKHVLQSWKLRDDPNVLLLKYENIQKDHIGTVRRIAEFCGKTLTEEQIKTIADYTKVGNMKKVYESTEMAKNDGNYTNFIRKGAVGEWNKYFSKEQLEYVESLLKEAEKEGLVFDDKLD